MLNHEELKQDINNRLDRLEDDLKAQINKLDQKMDNMLQSTAESKVRLEGMSGQVKLLWTFFLALSTGVAKLFTDYFTK